jgi:mycothiol system anti-sigma-R factor
MSQPVNPFIASQGKKPSCLEMLHYILDGEATSEQKEYFRSHMDGCMPCFKAYNLDMAIKELLKTRCGECAPADLVEKIKVQIGQGIS